MQHFIYDAYLKLDRADEHLEELRREVAAFREKYLDKVLARLDRQSGDYLIEADSFPIPGRVQTLAGDVISNLRAAPDYLVYALAYLDSGEPQAGTQFPITDSPRRFEAAVKKRHQLRGLNAGHVAAIEQLQPYNGGDMLAVLREVSNPDKHRHLNGVISAVEVEFTAGGQVVSPTLTQMLNQAYRMSRLRRGLAAMPTQTVARGGGWASGIHPGAGNAVDLNLSVTVDIAFTQGPSLLGTVEALHIEVRELLDAFEPEFGS